MASFCAHGVGPTGGGASTVSTSLDRVPLSWLSAWLSAWLAAPCQYLYDGHGQLVRETRWNYDSAGNLLDSRVIGYAYDAVGNLTAEALSYADGQVSNGAYDIDPDPATNARTDLTRAHTTIPPAIGSAAPPAAIELAKATAPTVDV